MVVVAVAGLWIRTSLYDVIGGRPQDITMTVGFLGGFFFFHGGEEESASFFDEDRRGSPTTTTTHPWRRGWMTDVRVGRIENEQIWDERTVVLPHAHLRKQTDGRLTKVSVHGQTMHAIQTNGWDGSLLLGMREHPDVMARWEYSTTLLSDCSTVLCCAACGEMDPKVPLV